MSYEVIEIIEQINDIKALLYLNENFPPWLKEMCLTKIKELEIRKKFLSYKK